VKTNIGKVIGLISILISLVVVIILIMTAINIYAGGKTVTKTVTSPIEKTKNVQCLSQIRRIENAIQIYYVENGKYPERLEDLLDLSPQDHYCPITERLYNYDAAAGRVTCLGHP